jgi:predicted nucleic acid-binding protein
VTVFADTSALYALLDRADANHKHAVSSWTNLLNGNERFFASNYVLVESFALTQSRLGMDAVRLLQEDILPVITIHFVDREIHRSGISAMLSAGRRNLSFVDCVSFEIMRTLGIKTAFTFDPHFKEQGFTVIP